MTQLISTRAASCLVLMLKAAESSKRRLAAQIGSRAEDVARFLYECAVEDLDAWTGSVCFAPADEDAMRALDDRVARDALIVVQRGGNLGERINSVNAELLERGLRRQVFIGIDCPSLDGDYLERAARELEAFDVVLGPAFDGGVVLMGVNRLWPDLSQLAWSSEQLCSELHALCRDSGLSVSILDSRADVDTLADLLAVGPALNQDQRAARRALSQWLLQQRDLAVP